MRVERRCRRRGRGVIGGEFALHEIRGRCLGEITSGRRAESPAVDALDALQTRQSRDALAAGPEPVGAKLGVILGAP